MLRRQFLTTSLSALSLLNVLGRRKDGERRRSTGSSDGLAAIERRLKGRLGVAFHDTASGRHLEYHANDRFPMCSTFKWLLAAQVVERVQASKEDSTRVMAYFPEDPPGSPPRTGPRMDARGKTIWALAEAAISYSDNESANLLLERVGGPAGFTAWLRSIGDPMTRLDRTEPELNSAEPGDPRDTTTPNAMVADLRALLLGPRLSVPLRDRLTGWLVVNTTGAARFRAALPSGWHIGDKTGTGGHGSTNDVAIVWPPGRAPVLVAAYLTETVATIQAREAALADVGRVMVEWVSA